MRLSTSPTRSAGCSMLQLRGYLVQPWTLRRGQSRRCLLLSLPSRRGLPTDSCAGSGPLDGAIGLPHLTTADSLQLTSSTTLRSRGCFPTIQSLRASPAGQMRCCARLGSSPLRSPPLYSSSSDPQSIDYLVNLGPTKLVEAPHACLTASIAYKLCR